MTTFTIIHVIISLIGIGSGLLVVGGLLSGGKLSGWTAVFLATTVATSATGFGFPFTKFLPSHAVGIVSLLVLAVAIAARYAYRLRGFWRPTYVITAVVALYLNVFVLIVQTFLKVPALIASAPTQTAPPFAIIQLIALAAFILLGIMATIRFREP